MYNISNNPPELTLEFRCANGASTEFYAKDEKHIAKVLRSLASPRLFSQTELVLGSQKCVSTITARAIDIILARTTAPLPAILPMNSPAGPVEVSEVGGTPNSHETSTTVTEEDGKGRQDLELRTFRVEIHTSGGWKSVLEVRAHIHGTVQDRRQTFAHVFHVPVIPFKLATGGFGLINPGNLVLATSYPSPDSLPETALPVEVVCATRSRTKNLSRWLQPVQP